MTSLKFVREKRFGNPTDSSSILTANAMRGKTEDETIFSWSPTLTTERGVTPEALKKQKVLKGGFTRRMVKGVCYQIVWGDVGIWWV
ncbi:hypothetical protein ACFX15_008575 [Malus domestica]